MKKEDIKLSYRSSGKCPNGCGYNEYCSDCGAHISDLREKKKGIEVKITFSDEWPGDKITTLPNITEIHYRYPSYEKRIAFESDIDGTGYTYKISHIKEFEAVV